VGKYLHVFGIGIQNTLVYRVNFLFRSSFALIPLTGTLYLWRAIYGGAGAPSTIDGYSLGEMISYYLLVTVVDALTAVAEDDWQIAADIKDGNISQFLLKPIDYFAYRLCLYVSGRAIYTTMALVPVLLFAGALHRYFAPPAGAGALAAAIVGVALGGFLQFLIAYCMALMSFWVLEVSTFIFIQFAFEYLASGHLFPLDILPSGLAKVIEFTPYPYLLYFPVGVYLGRITGNDMWRGFAIEGFWLAAMYATARLVWARGLRRYTASGG
jgi:ABC-2 type transport system permease protein